MSEHMMPIPSRLYNAAVGGHVAGADQIIDDETGLTLDKVTGGALEEKEYTSGSNNGMGRVVLRKNLVEGVNTLVQTMINKSNTIYVIQYDFTLGENITVPANCVLEFDGGSISSTYTLTGQNTGINAGLVKIFNTNITIAGSWNVNESYPEWFGAVGDGVTDDTNTFKKLISCNFYAISLTKTYLLTDVIGNIQGTKSINGGGTILNHLTTEHCLFNLDSDGLCINNITFDSDNVGSGAVKGVCSNLKITNCIFKNYKLIPTLSYAYRGQITLDSGSNITIYGCSFINNGYDAGSATGTDALSRSITIQSTVKNAIVTNNIFSYVMQGIVVGTQTDNIIIEGNIFEYYKDNAIYALGADVTINSNRFAYAPDEAIVCTGKQVIIANNEFKDIGNYVIRLNDNVGSLQVVNNIVRTTSNQAYGCGFLQQRDGSHEVNSAIISNNIIDFTECGANVTISMNTYLNIISYAKIDGNYIKGYVRGNASGIFRFVDYPEFLTVTNNYVFAIEYAQYQQPLYFENGDRAATSSRNISGNVFKNMRGYGQDLPNLNPIIKNIFNNHGTCWDSDIQLFASTVVPNHIPANGSICINTGGNSPLFWKVVNGAWVAIELASTN